jgi:hypothetical protein
MTGPVLPVVPQQTDESASDSPPLPPGGGSIFAGPYSAGVPASLNPTDGRGGSC